MGAWTTDVLRQPAEERWRGPARRGWIRGISRFAYTQPVPAAAVAVILLITLLAILAPLIAPFNPRDTSGGRFQPPGGRYLMGTDQVGRDVASRVIWGARLSLEIGVASVAIGVTLGSLWGILSAYLRGLFDLITQRVVDTLGAFPPILLALGLMAGLGASVLNVIVALAIVFAPTSARMVRSVALSVAQRPYVGAAQSIGASATRILFRHVAPNCVATIIVLCSLFIAEAIIIEASLSFLGAGVPPEEPSWGGMLTYAAQAYVTLAPWMAIFPGLALTLTVLALNLVGDAVRDTLDPRLRRF